MEILLTPENTIIGGVIIALVSSFLSAFFTYLFGSKRNRRKILHDLYTNFQEDNENFRKEVLEEKNRAKKLNEELEETLNFYKAEYNELMGKYAKTEQLLQEIKRKYETLEKKMKEVQEELIRTKEERDEIKTKFEKVDADYQEAVKEIKKLRSIMNNMNKSVNRKSKKKD